MAQHFFSFGFGHTNHDGRSLGNRYTIIEAPTEAEARLKMVEVRAQKWCTSYPTAEAIGVERWGLKLLPFEELGPQVGENI